MRIKNGTVVTPSGVVQADVAVENGLIVSVDGPASQHPRTAADEVIDASGLHVLPGVIDAHVHFREPGSTHKEDLRTGSMACAKGGVTTFFEMPNTTPPAVDQAGVDRKLALAAQKSVVDFGFYIGATPTNTPWLAKAERVPGIKVFIGSSTGDLLVDEHGVLERLFAETTLPICAHCEDEATVRANLARVEAEGFPNGHADHSRVRDHAAAIVCTRRATELAVRHGHRFHVLHVSTADELPVIRHARPTVTGEACPHHLFFSADDYARLGPLVQMNPALKTKADGGALFDALLDGTLQMVATDHAPHTLDEKRRPYPESPSGVPAVENALALMLNEVNTGRCTLEAVVHWMCEAPAFVWDVVNKGRIAAGYDADLVLVDMEKRATVRNANQLTKCGWSPWDGEELMGWPVRTLVRGRTVFADGRVDETARGRPAVFDHARGGYWAEFGVG